MNHTPLPLSRRARRRPARPARARESGLEEEEDDEETCGRCASDSAGREPGGNVDVYDSGGVGFTITKLQYVVQSALTGYVLDETDSGINIVDDNGHHFDGSTTANVLNTGKVVHLP
jgi:hypothetical protein